MSQEGIIPANKVIFEGGKTAEDVELAQKFARHHKFARGDVKIQKDKLGNVEIVTVVPVVMRVARFDGDGAFIAHVPGDNNIRSFFDNNF